MAEKGFAEFFTANTEQHVILALKVNQ